MSMTRQLGLVRITAQAGTPQTNKISHNWRPQIRQTVHRIPRRQVVHSQPFELGEDAPGTGRRQFPASVATEEDDRAAATRSEIVDFQKKTTQECYEEFPVLVRSSVPLYVVSEGPQEPLGEVEKRTEDGGPTTGSRRRPDPVDPSKPCYYDVSQEELLRQVQMRRSC
eukprot:jgi/Botrbrau1/23545/Bobra.0141s0016.1